MATYPKPKSVDVYLASQKVAWQKATLTRLREVVHETDPGIGEEIKWSAPYFMYGSTAVAWMFAATEWVHFSFLEGALLDHSHGFFEETDNIRARTIKIREGEIIPEATIKKLIKQAVTHAKAGKRVELKRPKPGSQEFDLPKEYETWLSREGRLEDYLERPFYQQRGWIEWIEDAKTEETKQKRKHMMLIEIKHNQYMPNAADRFKE